MTEPTKERPRRRPYCLRCFATLPDGESLCRDCDFVSTPSMRARYWSQVPWMCALDRRVKAGGMLVAVPVAAWLTFQVRGSQSGYIVAVPLMAYAALHMSVGKLTHQSPHFHPGVFWAATFVSGALLFLAIAALLVIRTDSVALVIQALVATSLCLVGSRLSLVFSRLAAAWKRRLMAGLGASAS